jgi:hypothetical protein
VRPTTLTEKMTMRVISGARIRRITRKIVEDAWFDDSMCTRNWVRLVGSRRLNSCAQKINSGLLTGAPASTAMEGDGFDHQQHYRNQVGQQCATGQGDHARCISRGHALL